MAFLSLSIVLLAVAGVVFSSPLTSVASENVRLNRYSPVRMIMDTLCTTFETSFCKGEISPATANHILPEVRSRTIATLLIEKSSTDEFPRRRSKPEKFRLFVGHRNSRTIATLSTSARSTRYQSQLERNKTAVLLVTMWAIVCHGCSIPTFCNATTMLQRPERSMAAKLMYAHLEWMRQATKKCLDIQSCLGADSGTITGHAWQTLPSMVEGQMREAKRSKQQPRGKYHFRRDRICNRIGPNCDKNRFVCLLGVIPLGVGVPETFPKHVYDSTNIVSV